MEKGFQRLHLHLITDLKELYSGKKTEENGLEATFKFLEEFGTWIENKRKMTEEVAKETCTNMTVALDRIMELELNITKLVKRNYTQGRESFTFLTTMCPVRLAAKEWPPKTFAGAGNVVAHMEEALADMLFYYTLYKDETGIFKEDFARLKELIGEIKVGMKLEELLHFSVLANIDSFSRHVVKFEAKLADI